MVHGLGVVLPPEGLSWWGVFGSKKQEATESCSNQRTFAEKAQPTK